MTTTDSPDDGPCPSVAEGKDGARSSPVRARRGPVAEDADRAGVGSAVRELLADPTPPVCAWCTWPIAPGTGAEEAPDLRHASCLARELQQERECRPAPSEVNLFRVQW